MAINQALIAELKHEAQSTRKILERVPAEHFGWKPHEKSMTLQKLSSHISNLPSWVGYTISQDELDLSGSFPQFVPTTTEELLNHHDEFVNKALALLETATDDVMMKPWTLRKGGHVIMEQPKVAVLRSMVMNHMIHHRGQLTVYLRLLNVPVPGVYGPSADDIAAMAAANN